MKVTCSVSLNFKLYSVILMKSYGHGIKTTTVLDPNLGGRPPAPPPPPPPLWIRHCVQNAAKSRVCHQVIISYSC